MHVAAAAAAAAVCPVLLLPRAAPLRPTSTSRCSPLAASFNGLSTWNSDVDLVVTGLVKPSRITGGFSHNDKRLVYKALDKIAAQLRRCGQHWAA